MSLGSFSIGFVVGLVVGEVVLLFCLAFFRTGEPSGRLPSIEPEGSFALAPSLQEQDAAA
jgi:hypothetical protein